LKFYFDSKGGSSQTKTVTNPAFSVYVIDVSSMLNEYGLWFWVKIWIPKKMKVKGGKLEVIIEFLSKKGAIDAYKSLESKRT
tara:strand:+ start:129 stop:374 length:246 start_codon:yes stop_codon:yes gene_type:complete